MKFYATIPNVAPYGSGHYLVNADNITDVLEVLKVAGVKEVLAIYTSLQAIKLKSQQRLIMVLPRK